MKTIKYLLAILIIVTLEILPQNIEAKLGTSGYFQIKNHNNNTILSVSNDELSLNFTGSLTLSNSSNYNSGVIYKGDNSFLHDRGINNVFLGKNAGNFFFDEPSAVGNTGVGAESMMELISGLENSAFGLQSLKSNASGSYNSAYGVYSLRNNIDGFSNSAFGNYTLELNTSGSYNSAFGLGALRSNTTGNFNTASGLSALYNNTTGVNNTAYGHQSLVSNTEGFHNTAVGYQSLFNNTGNYNTALGFNAGSTVTTGANLTLLGIDANPSSPTALDEITLGNQFVQTLRCNTTTITSLSDARDKKNIKDLSLGLDFLMNIQPRQFNWDRREWYENGKSDGSKMLETPTAGFIAQELDKVQSKYDAEWLKLVLKENPDRIEASAGNLFPIVVKAIQDLKNEKDKEIALLKSENEKLKSELELIKELQNRLAKIEQVVKIPDVKFTSNITE